MSRHLVPTLIASLAALTVVTSSPSAGEIDLTGSLGGGASSRDDDAVGSAALRGRYAIRPMFAVSVNLGAGAAENDERTIGSIVAAAEFRKRRGRWLPAIRLGFVHQHETALEDAEENPLTVTLGVDETIRHRTGAAFEVGTTLDFFKLGRGAAFGSADLSTHVMFDDNGPRSYVLLALGVGYRFGN